MGEHQFRENGSHYNGGTEFFGYGYTAVGEPRLTMTRYWYRKGKKRGTAEDAFYVDGACVDSYAAAVEALKTPPTFSDDERAVLATIDDDPADWRKLLPLDLLLSLAAKGALAWGPPGHCARTDLGRAVLAPREVS